MNDGFIDMQYITQVLHLAAEYGKLDILKHFADFEKYPDENCAKYAIENDHFEIVQWMVDNRMYLNTDCANTAAMMDDIESLDLLATIDVYPDYEGYIKAACMNRVKSLDWLYNHNVEMPSDKSAFSAAIDTGSTDSLIWLHEHK